MMSEQQMALISEKLGGVGAAFYFDPATLESGKALGLDGFQFYGIGRGGVLGNVDAAVVQSAFGYFHPDMVANLWNPAKQIAEPRAAGSAYMEAARDYGRAHFSEVDELAAFCDAAEALIANIHPAGLALYAAVAAEPLCDDVAGRAMQLAVVLREYRGSVHLVAIVAEGIEPARAHFVKRPDDYQLFGYSDEPAPATDTEVRAHAAAESRTTAIYSAALATITAEQVDALATGATAMADAVG